MPPSSQIVASKYIERAARQYEDARAALSTSGCDVAHVDLVAAALLLVARIDSLEDSMIAGLATAGEGV